MENVTGITGSRIKLVTKMHCRSISRSLIIFIEKLTEEYPTIFGVPFISKMIPENKVYQSKQIVHNNSTIVSIHVNFEVQVHKTAWPSGTVTSHNN